MLGHLDVGRVEERRGALDLRHLVTRVAPQQPRRGVESAGVQEDLVAVLVDVDDHRVGVGRDACHRFALPRAGCGDLHATGDVDQGEQDQPVPRPGEGLQAGVLVGLENDSEIRLSRRGIRRTWRPAANPAGYMVDPSHQSVRGRINSHSRCTDDPGVGGHVDADQFLAAQFVAFAVEEVERPRDEQALEARRGVVARADADVGGFAGEQRRRLRQRLTPAPALDDPRISGVGQRTRAEVGAHQNGIRAPPSVMSVLASGSSKPPATNVSCPHVEFADDGGIRPAARQADQRQRADRVR